MEFICCCVPALIGLVAMSSLLGTKRISPRVFWIGAFASIVPGILLVASIFYYSTFHEGLVTASAEGNVQEVERLIRWGADPNEDVSEFGYPLWAAVENDHADVVLLLLKHGANPNVVNDSSGNEDPRSMVRMAADAKHWDIVKMLKAAGGRA